MEKREPKLASVIAKEIETRILVDGWRTDDVFATEAELRRIFGVSRATVREAIGQIERKGIVRAQRGHGGGIVVSTPTKTATSLAFATYLELVNSDLGQMLEARVFLEGLSVHLACERISEFDVERLKSQLDQLSLTTGSVEEVSRAQTRIREMIAEASGNQLVSIFMEALDYSSLDIIAFHLGDIYSMPDLTAEGARLKRKLVNAIINCDQALAYEVAMQDASAQITTFREYLRETRANAQIKKNRDGSSRTLKLGHLVALKISDEIRANGYPVGFRIGSEPQLVSKYGVSRAIFREAVRLLEAHSIAFVKRGNDGGLTVSTPDPAGVIDSVVLYLRHMNLDVNAISEVRERLDLGAVQLAARRVTQEDRRHIGLAIDELKKAKGVDAHLRCALAVHQRICDASHNPVLALLVGTCLSALAEGVRGEVISADHQRAIRDNYIGIAEAVIGGNEGLARRRTIRHFEVARSWWSVRR